MRHFSTVMEDIERSSLLRPHRNFRRQIELFMFSFVRYLAYSKMRENCYLSKMSFAGVKAPLSKHHLTAKPRLRGSDDEREIVERAVTGLVEFLSTPTLGKPAEATISLTKAPIKVGELVMEKTELGMSRLFVSGDIERAIASARESVGEQRKRKRQQIAAEIQSVVVRRQKAA